MHHRVLQRQMKKYGVVPDHPPQAQEAWARFLERVDRFYHEADQDRYLLERSLSISSHEMQDLYEQLLQASETRVAVERDRLRTVISSLGAGLCTLDSQGRVLSINPEGERLLGCAEADVRGRPFFAWSVASGDGHAPGGRCTLEDVVAFGQPCREEDGVFRRTDGTHLPVSYTINPIIEDGTLRGAVLVFFDITERKQAGQALRESEERHRTLLNHLPVGVYRSTPEGRFIKANPATADLFGAESVEDLMKRDVPDLFFNVADRDRFVVRLLRDGLVTAEFAIRRLDGRVIWVRDYARAIEDETTDSIYFDGILLDITEQKQAAEALRESEARSRALLAAIPDLMFQLRSDGTFLDFKGEEDHLVMPAEAIVGSNLADAPLPPDVLEPLLRCLKQAVATGEVQIYEYELPLPKGVHTFEARVVQCGDDEALCIVRNVTERKQAEEALRESEQRFRDLFESSPDAIFVEDFDGNVLDANPAACRLHNSGPDALIGQNVRALVPPEQQQASMEAFARMVLGELDRLEGSSWTIDGDEVPVEIRASRITQDHEPALLLQVRDITERKQAEQRLRLLEASVSASLDGITISDACAPDYPLVYSSPGFERMTGYSAEEIIGRNCRFLQVDDRDQPALEEIRDAIQTGTQCRVVLRNYRKDGALFWNELTLYPLHDNTGRLTHYVGIQRDITQRKRVEEALRRSEERYTLAVSAGNVGVWDWNLETNEIYIDPNLKQILGYADDEINNHLDDWARLVHPDDQEIVMEAATAHLEGRTPVYDVEHRMLHRSGGVRWFVAWGTAMRDAQGKPVRMVGTDTDITERKQAEQERARINAALEQRNRELQDFAYVASHDLQEPLRKIRAFADLMQEDYGDKVDKTGHYYLDRMQDAAARMSGLITDLLVYSRVTTEVRPFGRVDLNGVVADILSDLEMQIEETGGRITVSNLPTIEADATQMHQLLQNFIGNALKFHRSGVPPAVDIVGQLDQQPAQDGGASQAMCRLEVRDNGIGFDEKYLDRIFTPFQRLHGRSTYAGTGMGLAICRRIVERHHGVITARSTPGEGATFIVTLPVYQSPDRSDGHERGSENGV